MIAPVDCRVPMKLARTAIVGRDYTLSPGRLEELCELKSEGPEGLGSSSELKSATLMDRSQPQGLPQ